MHQERWLYNGIVKQHYIQLNHFFGDEIVTIRLNGELLYHESYPMTQDSKSYQFFIDNELCEIRVAKDNNDFVYHFTSHNYSTSKTGMARKQKDFLEEWGVGIGIAAVFLLILCPLAYYLLTYYQNSQNLDLGGMMATAIITQIGAEEAQQYTTRGITYRLTDNVRYKFEVNGAYYHGDIDLKPTRTGGYMTPNGLPLHEGGEFEVLFSGLDPSKSKILFDKPTSIQTNKYKALAAENCLYNPPNDVDSSLYSQFCKCMNYHVYLHYGLEGLANVFAQNMPRTQQVPYNQETFERMQNDVIYKSFRLLCKDEVLAEEEEDSWKYEELETASEGDFNAEEHN